MIPLIILFLFLAFVCIAVMSRPYIEQFKQCQKIRIDMKQVIPPPFDPFQGASKLAERSYIYTKSNVDFEKMIDSKDSISVDTTDFVSINDAKIKAKLRDQVVMAFLKQNPLVLESGFQYITSLIDSTRTDYKYIYAVVYLILHQPSTAYGKAVKIRAEISIMDNKVTRLTASLYGNIAASDIAQLSSSSS